MALLHKANGDGKTFSEMATSILASIMHVATGSKRIDVVFDVYNDVSIKNAERETRMSDSGVLFSTITPGHKIRQWRRLLRCSASKTALTRFLADEWMTPTYLAKLDDVEMYVTYDDQCIKLTNRARYPALATTHEEADCRLLLHAKHASHDFGTIIIASEDTDVLILCLAFSKEFDNVYIRCGSSSRIRYINVTQLALHLGMEACSALIGMHAFTGCDSVSCFAGRGNVSPLKHIIQSEMWRKTMIQLGQAWELSDERFTKIQQFTCQMYASRTTVTNVNELRYHLFRAKKGDIESGQLPPCQDCLYQHTARANYQAALWRSSLEATPVIPSPVGHGWWIEDGKLTVRWMTGPPAPEVVLELVLGVQM
jgi:hypothetical protein